MKTVKTIDKNALVHYTDGSSEHLISFFDFDPPADIDIYYVTDSYTTIELKLYINRAIILSDKICLFFDDFDNIINECDFNIKKLISNTDFDKLKIMYNTFHLFKNFPLDLDYDYLQWLPLVLDMFDVEQYSEFTKTLPADFKYMCELPMTLFYDIIHKNFNIYYTSCTPSYIITDKSVDYDIENLLISDYGYTLKLVFYIAYKQNTLTSLIESIEKWILR